MNKPFLGYNHLTRSCYAEKIRSAGLDRDVTDEILIGSYYPEGGAKFEFAIRWHRIDNNAPVPRIELFHSSWKALNEVRDLFEPLISLDAQTVPPNPDMIRTILEFKGFRDMTKYEAPEEVQTDPAVELSQIQKLLHEAGELTPDIRRRLAGLAAL